MKPLLILALVTVLTGCAMTPEEGLAVQQAFNGFNQGMQRDADRRASYYQNTRSYNCTGYTYGNRTQTTCR